MQVFTREGIVRDKRAQQIIDDQLKDYKKDLADQLRIVEEDLFQRLEKVLLGKDRQRADRRKSPRATRSQGVFGRCGASRWFDIRLADDDEAQALEAQKPRPPTRKGIRSRV